METFEGFVLELRGAGHDITRAEYTGPLAWRVQGISAHTGQPFEIRANACTGPKMSETGAGGRTRELVRR